MGTRLPQHKGTGLIPVVKALKSDPRGKEAVPKQLQRYLHENIVASEWYPEEDYSVLLNVLADLVVSDEVPDVWTLFGITGAQRDLAGEQGLIREENRLENVGVYRRFVGNEPTSVASMFRRLVTLWSAYHDTGRMLIEASSSDDCTVYLRLYDFKFPVLGIAELQGAYACEYARLLGIHMQCHLTRTTARGDALDEWEYIVKRSAEVVQSIAELPRVVR